MDDEEGESRTAMLGRVVSTHLHLDHLPEIPVRECESSDDDDDDDVKGARGAVRKGTPHNAHVGDKVTLTWICVVRSRHRLCVV